MRTGDDAMCIWRCVDKGTSPSWAWLVTATKSWSPTPTEKVRREDANQRNQLGVFWGNRLITLRANLSVDRYSVFI
jgi:hypothetical protein